MMELQIISPTEEGFIKQIRWNYEEVKNWVAGRMQQYEGLVLTEDQVVAGRKDLADLRKLKDALENERKRVKAKCLEAYGPFSEQIGEVTALVDRQIGNLDLQIKDYGQQKKTKKTNRIHDLYDAQIGVLKEILPFDRIMNPRWLNVTVSLKAIEKEIAALTARVNSDLDTIEGLGSAYDTQIRDVYIRTLDLSAALQEKARLEEQARQLAERQALKEVQLAKKQEEEAGREAEPQREPEGGQTEETAPFPEQEPCYTVALEVWGSRAQLMEFQEFLNGRGIAYKVTEKAKRIR